jgi:hypothetical protein
LETEEGPHFWKMIEFELMGSEGTVLEEILVSLREKQLAREHYV